MINVIKHIKEVKTWYSQDKIPGRTITIYFASTVLQNIRNGGTQLTAFKEVAKLLNRTPAACGFRWNSYVRKQYQEEIQQAKQNREVGNNISPSQQKETYSLSLTLDDIILFLQNYKNI